MMSHLTTTEVETLANLKHQLQTSSCNWQACTETVDSFNKDEFTRQLNAAPRHMLLQSTAPLY